MVSIGLVLINGFVAGSILILMALGMTLIFGVMDIINFAHGIFYTLGAYFSFVLFYTFELPLVASILLSVLIVALLGIAMDQTIIRAVRQESVWVTFLVTLGVAYMLQEILHLLMGSDPRYFQVDVNVINVFGVTYGSIRIVTALSSLLLIGLTFVFLNFTTTGKQIRAVAQNPLGSRLVGIRSNRIYMLTFGIGTLLAGVAGALNGLLFPLTPTMGETALINAFIVIIIGGLGSISGAAIAGLLLGMIQSVASVFLSDSQVTLLFYAALVITLLVRPEGLITTEGSDNA